MKFISIKLNENHSDYLRILFLLLFSFLFVIILAFKELFHLMTLLTLIVDIEFMKVICLLKIIMR